MRVRLFSIIATLALVLSTFSGFAPQPATAAATLKSVSASGTVIGGGKIQIKIVLTDKAPSGGTKVTLNSNRPSIVPVPASVTVPAGQTTAYASDIVTKGTQTSVIVTITGKLRGLTKSGVTLIRAPYVAGVSGKSAVGPGPNSVTIRLAAKAGVGGMVVKLKSSRPSSVILPAEIKVLEGQTAVVLAYTVPTTSSPLSYVITAEANDKGAAVVPPDKIVQPVQFSATSYPNGTPTPTMTATKTATPTKTATATVTGPTATTTPDPCGSFINLPETDAVNDDRVAVTDVWGNGAFIRVTNTTSTPFSVTLYIHNGPVPILFNSQTVWTRAITGSFDEYTIIVATHGTEKVNWDFSCTISAGSSSSSDPEPSATPTMTAIPATMTPTEIPPVATDVAQSEGCQAIADGQFDQAAPGWTWSAVAFNAGEVVTFAAAGAPFDLTVDSIPIAQGSTEAATWVVPESGAHSIELAPSETGEVTWDIDCT